MVKKTGKFVARTIFTAGAISQIGSATNVPQASSLNASLVQGSARVVAPALKIKSTSMVLKSVKKLNKKAKQLI